MSELYIGVMSGTSLDGVDVVLVDFSKHQPLVQGAFYQPFNATLRDELLALQTPGIDEIERAAVTANTLTECYAGSVHALLHKCDVRADAVKAIGCHGQTLRHRPECGFSIQLNNPARLAEHTDITVVADFRSRDIAAGGQGAPLVPAFHQSIFSDPERHRVVVNLGGIANLTDLPPSGQVRGFDTGPANILLDAWCHSHGLGLYDKDGAWGAGGHVNGPLLQTLLAEPYFEKPPPKSTGRDLFNLRWLIDRMPTGMSPADVQRTLMELTSSTVATAIRRYCPGAQEILVCGGGARNAPLMAHLAALLAPIPVAPTDRYGVLAEYVEAMAFAWLAKRAMERQPGNVPAVTGAAGPRVLGAVYWR